MDEENGPGRKIVQARDPGGDWRDLRPIAEGERLIVYPGTRLRLRPELGEPEIDHVLQDQVADENGLIIGREIVPPATDV